MFVLALILAFIGGLAILASKALNNAAAIQLGLLRGSVLNYITGTLVAGFMALIFTGFSPLAQYGSIPWHYYLAGALGLAAMLISNATLHRLPVVHTTALIICAQMATALAVDYLLFGKGSLLKIAGSVLVLIALVWDQGLIRERGDSASS